jgi:hypothetical protein
VADREAEGLESSDSSPRSTTQRQQVLDKLRASQEPLSAVEIGEAIGIPSDNGPGTRLTELYDEGLVEPVTERFGRGRRLWRAVPEERRAEVREQAVDRHKQRLLRTFQKQPLPIQGWLVERMLVPPRDHEEEQRLLQELCPGLQMPSDCTCNSLNVWVTRHRSRKGATRSRASHSASELRRLRREHRLAMEAAQKEDPTAVQYLTYKRYVREAAVYISHMVGFVEDEIDYKKEQGYSELSDQKWLDIRDMALGEDGVQSALDELKKALDSLIDDQGDWLDVEEVEDIEDLEIEDAEILELEPGFSE